MTLAYGAYTVQHKGSIDDISNMCRFNEYFLQSVKNRLKMVDKYILSKLEKDMVRVKFILEGSEYEKMKKEVNAIIEKRKQTTIVPSITDVGSIWNFLS